MTIRSELTSALLKYVPRLRCVRETVLSNPYIRAALNSLPTIKGRFPI